METDLLVILGPTASGKTQLACQLAAVLNGEIISADSRQLYRHMDIGTGKDLEEYEVNGQKILYHLIDIQNPGYRYNIAEFQLDFINSYQDIRRRGAFPILCGGSGLYIETALKGNSYMGIPQNNFLREEAKKWSPEELQKKYVATSRQVQSSIPGDTDRRKIRAIEIHQYLNLHRDFQPRLLPKIRYHIVGVDIDRELRREKITNRLKARLEEGLIEEVQFLLDHHLTHDDLEYYGLEYKWVGLYLKGELIRRQMFEKLNVSIHQFAKRQMTWFRRMEKQGYDIQWVDSNLEMEEKVQQILAKVNPQR